MKYQKTHSKTIQRQLQFTKEIYIYIYIYIYVYIYLQEKRQKIIDSLR